MFDIYSAGHDLLKAVIAYTYRHYPHLPVIVDCKVGDIDNTMSAYIENMFGKLQADGIVVNPLMGDDVLAPLMEVTDKAIVVLCKTSNPGGSIVQDALMADGRPLWEHLLELTTTRWNSSGNMVPVVSSTAGLDMAHVRRLIPDNMPVLLAGVGAQGGSYADLGKLLNCDRANVFVNSSRGILYPYDRNDEFWINRIVDAARAMMIDMEAQRYA
jgi:orotidine-5'-phosphate decarboxylase